MDLGDWIGRSMTASDVLTAGPCAALAATLDCAPDRPVAGTRLPPLWHWLYFRDLARRSDLGPDGHARRGGFLPPVTLPRRMWAGGELRFHAPLRIGDALTRTSTIAEVTRKSGRSGGLVFVKVRHEIVRAGDTAPALSEVHDIVYRGAPRPDEAPPASAALPEAAAWRREWTPDPVLLFRYSALTFNGHRIHYDRSYAIGTEGYPGLVVHGPLIATLLLELLRHALPEAAVTAYRFRAVRPTFDTAPFLVNGRQQPDGRSVRLWAQDQAGALTMDAMAEIA